MTIVFPQNEYKGFLNEIISEVKKSQYKAYQATNRNLVELYWSIGQRLHGKVEVSQWGESIVEKLAIDLRKEFPDVNGFNRRNLYRMIQFYKTYRDNKFVSEVLTQINWTNNLLILSKSASLEERDFYVPIN